MTGSKNNREGSCGEDTNRTPVLTGDECIVTGASG